MIDTNYFFKGSQRYTRLCEAAGRERYEYQYFYEALGIADGSMFLRLATDEFAWLDGAHVEVMWRAWQAKHG